MRGAKFNYHRADHIEGALSLLADFGDEGKVLAGGQSLVPMMALRLARPENLVDVTRVPELQQLDVIGDWLEIGAATRHVQVERSAEAEQAVPLLARTMPHIGHAAIRTRGTICGSLAHADPSAELPAVAVTLGAQFDIRSADRHRVVDAADFFVGSLQSAIDDGELLAAVRFPVVPARTGYAIDELSRRHGDFAMIGAVAAVTVGEDLAVSDVALTYFGAAGTPLRLANVESLIEGEALDDELIAEASALVAATIEPPSDLHASAAYRSHCAGVLTGRVLRHAHAEAARGEP